MRVLMLILGFALPVQGCAAVIGLQAQQVRNLPSCAQIVYSRARMPRGIYICQNENGQIRRYEVVPSGTEVPLGTNDIPILR
jgi:hypothetical protein